MLLLCPAVLAVQAQFERAEPAFEARVLWVTPDPSGGGFGHTITPLGDLDGDGGVDLVVGAPDSVLFRDRPGRVCLLNGRTGHVFGTCVQPVEHVHRGWGDIFPMRALAVGDLDGDGWQDALMSVANDSLHTTRLCVLSGRTRKIVAELAGDWGSGFGLPAARWGDVDCDGIDEWLAQERAEGGRIVMRSGLDRAIVRCSPPLVLAGAHARPSFSVDLLEVIRDLDGDGIADILRGGPSPEAPNGWIGIYSGLDLSFVRALIGGQPLGSASAAIHAGEVFVRLSESDGYVLHALALDGTRGRVVTSIERPRGTGFMTWIPIDDLDGDGVAEILWGFADSIPPKLSVISGTNGASLGQPIELPNIAEDEPTRLGYRLVSAGDLDRDCRAEIAVQLCAGPEDTDDEDSAVCAIKLSARGN